MAPKKSKNSSNQQGLGISQPPIQKDNKPLNLSLNPMFLNAINSRMLDGSFCINKAREVLDSVGYKNLVGLNNEGYECLLRTLADGTEKEKKLEALYDKEDYCLQDVKDIMGSVIEDWQLDEYIETPEDEAESSVRLKN